MLTKKLRAALAFARRHHEGQQRKHGLDYVFHPEEVAALLAFRYGVEQEDVLCAALLHDVIEESGCQREEIAERFGQPVAAMVAALSRRKDRPYKEYAEQLSKEPTAVILIKGADVLSNLRDSLLANEKTRHSVTRHARRYILPLARERLGDGHPLVRDLEIVLSVVETRPLPAA